LSITAKNKEDESRHKYFKKTLKTILIRKGQVEEIQCALSEAEFINKIMGIAV